MLDVCLLGCGGMLPLPKRFLTSLLVRYQGKGILIDCGESTQVALHLCGWSVKQIDHMLITHFHGGMAMLLPNALYRGLSASLWSLPLLSVHSPISVHPSG